MDTIAVLFSAQRIVEQTLNHRVTFAYWGVHGLGKTQLQASFWHRALAGSHTFRNHAAFTDRWDLVEFLVTSPEPPI